MRNAHTQVCNARIQGIYDLLSGSFISFSVDPYSKNDQAASLEIPVQPGDLVLRDRGYFNVGAVAKQKQAGADSINRYKHPTALFDPDTGQKINLLELLTRKGSVDREVLAGAEEKLKLRLIAVPTDEETANRRRMKAKKESNGHAPSQELLKLMSWTIFLTTIRDGSMTFEEILNLYGLRGRIENIFKTWKGNFNFGKVHNVSETQLHVLLTARLIMITIAHERLFVPLSRQLQREKGKVLSLMKFMRYISQNTESLTQRLPGSSLLEGRLYSGISRYCTYEKRTRPNFVIETRNILLATGTAYD